MPVAPLGIGLNYQPQLRPFIDDHAGTAFDFLEAVPDIFWVDHGRGAAPRYVDNAPAWQFLERIARRVPVVPHSIGLSIGSSHHFNRDHLAQMRACHARLDFPWHSDHLSFHLTGHEDPAAVVDDNVGITMPLPRTRATLDFLAERIREVQATVPVPFLLENNVYFVDFPDAEYTEPAFLAELCRTSGCGLVLDLHNVHTNALNLGFDAREFVATLDLTAVVEIHIAGGFTLGDYYYDSHSGPTPEPVWRLLEWVVPRAPNLAGIVFEIFGTWYGDMGADRLAAELARMRDVWRSRAAATAA